MSTTQQKEVTFISRCLNLRLVFQPEVWPTRAPSGALIDKGQPGKAIEFEDGSFTTSDPDEIEVLREHRNYNAVGASNGFYEAGRAPDEPQPTIKDQLGALARAAAKGDLQAIDRVVEVEKETHKREVVLVTATEYLEALAESDDPESEESSPSPSTSSETASTV